MARIVTIDLDKFEAAWESSTRAMANFYYPEDLKRVTTLVEECMEASVEQATWPDIEVSQETITKAQVIDSFAATDVRQILENTIVECIKNAPITDH